MEVRATAKYLHLSPRKARLVVDQVRGKQVDDALATLGFMPHKAAEFVGKVVKSAVANAENNFNLSAEDLFVSRIFVDQGPSMKRHRPRARGRAGLVIKRSSHITVIVDEKEV